LLAALALCVAGMAARAADPAPDSPAAGGITLNFKDADIR